MSENITREQFIKTLALGTAAAVLPSFGSFAINDTEKPNVLFVVCDDLNDWIGALGGNNDTLTPNIDKLAQRCVVFEKAYCTAPICNPSRASLMTGLRPSTTGVYGNRQPFRLSAKGKNAFTLTQHLRKNGYFAAGAGKIYHGKFPDPDSWDKFYPALDDQTTPDPKPSKENSVEVAGLKYAPLQVNDSEMGDFKTVEYCIKQLNKKHDKPFFLACGIRKPHLDWDVPQKYFDKFDSGKLIMPKMREDDLDDVPKEGKKIAKTKTYYDIKGEGKEREFVKAYLAAVSFADAMVGKMIDALDKSDYADNTIIVFLGDHGWHLTEKLHWKKSTLWEEATRAPLMISVPGLTPKGARCKRTISFLDIYPTIVELCGVQRKIDNEGHSFVSLLKNPSSSWRYPAVTTYLHGNHSVKTEDWRYIRYHDGTEELYDHRNDEMEWKNLADDQKYISVKEELKKWLPEYDAADSEIIVWPGDKIRDDDEIESE
ncbi:MAG: sulfatase [Bacteroidetes bacterium]|nr:sulfatase [Bacteroidota bacterium]